MVTLMRVRTSGRKPSDSLSRTSLHPEAPQDSPGERWTELSDDDLWAEREAYLRWTAAGGGCQMAPDAALWFVSRRFPVLIRNYDGAIRCRDKEWGVHRLWDAPVL